jgi:superfamily II DNA helicase RecQ
MSKLRSIFTSATLLGLSATVTAAVYADILVKLKLETTDVCLKAVPPDRPKIFLEVKRQKTFDTDADLDWIIDGIVNERQYFDKTVIFVQTIEMVGNIFMMLISRLGKNAYVGSVNDPERRLVSMFHGQIGETLTAYTLSEFPKPDSNIRVLVSTIAFGLGVEIPDIRTVVHWGRCKNVSALWQEFGRGGRDGEPSRAIWYPTSVAGEDQALFTKLKADRTTCIRETILSAFVLPGMRTISVMPTCDSRIRCVDCHCPSCSCCSNCRSRCKCHTVNQAEL